MTTVEKIRIMEDVRKLSESEWEEFKTQLLKLEPDETEETLATEVELKKLMVELGIPAHIKGYRYVQKAILLVVENHEMIESVTKLLYPTLAKHFDTTSSRAERAIRNAIEVGWERGNWDKINEIFGYTCSPSRGKPTNAEFIARIADYICDR